MINWTKQWEMHAPTFKNGKAHIKILGKSFQLLPGPGFGDLSHPTTRIMLRFLEKHIKGHTVLDIGCGSGILSIASHLLGANEVRGIDICPQALTHAKKNALENNLYIPFAKSFPDYKPTAVIMNMISSEQSLALSQNPNLSPTLWILSGYLANEKPNFIPHETLIEESWKGILHLTSN